MIVNRGSRPTRSIKSVALRRPALALALLALTLPGAARAQSGGSLPADERRMLMDRIEALERRLGQLESSAVLSEPETRIVAKEIWVDKNGVEYDDGPEQLPDVAAAKEKGELRKQITYQRQRAYRRQTIGEKIEEALSGAEESHVQLGVDASIVMQRLSQTRGRKSELDENAYALASADLYFSAPVAQNTRFFANLVGFSGSTPNEELLGRPLALNGYGARLDDPDEVNLREAWLQTGFFEQSLTITAGRLDLTNIFDTNTAANDEKTQFLADPLVVSPVLGLSSNGAGVAAVYDPKEGFSFKLGAQQSAEDAKNLSDSVFSLAEVGYLARPFSLPEGNYRLWYRRDNSDDTTSEGVGISVDQKLTAALTLFGRLGRGDADKGHNRFWSAGLQLKNGWVINPLDAWGFGFAKTDLSDGGSQTLTELYYNFHLAEKFRLSFHLQYSMDDLRGLSRTHFLVPGVRLQASF